MREKLWSFQSTSLEETESLPEILLEMWKHLTSSEMRGLMKLTMELNQRAIKGDAQTRRFLEQESQQWINSLYQLTKDEITAVSLFHLFQGAILDFLTTGNAERGYQTIQAFTSKLWKSTGQG